MEINNTSIGPVMLTQTLSLKQSVSTLPTTWQTYKQKGVPQTITESVGEIGFGADLGFIIDGIPLINEVWPPYRHILVESEFQNEKEWRKMFDTTTPWRKYIIYIKITTKTGRIILWNKIRFRYTPRTSGGTELEVVLTRIQHKIALWLFHPKYKALQTKMYHFTIVPEEDIAILDYRYYEKDLIEAFYPYMKRVENITSDSVDKGLMDDIFQNIKPGRPGELTMMLHVDGMLKHVFRRMFCLKQKMHQTDITFIKHQMNFIYHLHNNTDTLEMVVWQ